MTLDQVVNSLPNGLHDAELETINFDFVKREVRLELDIWIGDEIDREAYRRAEIVLSGLQFWVSDPPDPAYPFAQEGPVRIDVGPLTQDVPAKHPALSPTPADAFANWLYVSDWNGFIYVAAKQASFAWRGASGGTQMNLTGQALFDAMQACPYPDFDLDFKGAPKPVRDVDF